MFCVFANYGVAAMSANVTGTVRGNGAVISSVEVTATPAENDFQTVTTYTNVDGK